MTSEERSTIELCCSGCQLIRNDDHWPCNILGHTNAPVTMFRHDWSLGSAGDRECAICGNWTCGGKAVPAFGCVAAANRGAA